jgi:ComF family protein
MHEHSYTPPTSTLSLRTAVLNLFFPPLCPVCGISLERQTGRLVCQRCWRSIRALPLPLCLYCGHPVDTPGQPRCDSCPEFNAAFDRALAAVVYEDAARQLIHAFKFGFHQHLAQLLAVWLTQAWQLHLAGEHFDAIVPVPLHWTRLWWREFNQALLLAQHLSLSTGIPVCDRWLVRRRRTPQQSRARVADRLDYVLGAFAVPHPVNLSGRRVLLVDDVFTTGATAAECARMLKQAGAAGVTVLTVARPL